MTTTNSHYKYKIEEGIKIPDVRHGYRPYKHKYPFRDMKVGQSFLVPYTNPESKRVARYITHVGTRFEGMKFTTRKMCTGVRVWRIK